MTGTGEADDLLTLLTALEQRLHDPAVRLDAAAIACMLADDFREFGASGRVYDKSSILAALATEATAHAPASIEAGDFALLPLGPAAALLTYRSRRDGVNSRRSSLWVLRGDQWRIVFHQGTRCD